MTQIQAAVQLEKTRYPKPAAKPCRNFTWEDAMLPWNNSHVKLWCKIPLFYQIIIFYQLNDLVHDVAYSSDGTTLMFTTAFKLTL